MRRIVAAAPGSTCVRYLRSSPGVRRRDVFEPLLEICAVILAAHSPRLPSDCAGQGSGRATSPRSTRVPPTTVPADDGATRGLYPDLRQRPRRQTLPTMLDGGTSSLLLWLR